MIVLGIGALVLLTVLGAGGYVVVKLLNGGFGSEEPSRTTTAPNVAGPGGGGADPVTADYNGDGKGDISFREFTGKRIENLTAMSNGQSAFGIVVGKEGAPESQLLRGDFDGDGTSDRVTMQAPGKVDSATVAVSWGTGEEQTPDAALKLGDPHEYTTGITGDYDGDGKDDLALVTGEAKGTAELWVALATGDRGGDAFKAPVGFGATTWDVDRTRFVGGRFNDDEQADLAVVTLPPPGGDTVSVDIHANDGTSFESTDEVQEVDTVEPVTAVAAGNFDGDGLTEIGVGSSQNISVLKFADGRVDGRSEWLTGGLPHSLLTASDVDGDGDDDLVGFARAGDHWNIDVLVADDDSFGTPATWGRYDCPGSCDADALGVIDRS